MVLNHNIITKIWFYYWKNLYYDILNKSISNTTHFMSDIEHSIVIVIKRNDVILRYIYTDEEYLGNGHFNIKHYILKRESNGDIWSRIGVWQVSKKGYF